MDLIERQAAIDVFGDVHPLDYNTLGYVNKIKALPSAQPEIIYCKDCKFLRDTQYNILGTNLAGVGTDLISRQEAIDYCEALMVAERVQQTDDWGYGRERYNQTEAIKHHLEVVSSAQPMRKPGKWIKLDMHRSMEQYKCSACNSECYVPECMGEPLYAFCPNCGDRMEGEE